MTIRFLKLFLSGYLTIFILDSIILGYGLQGLYQSEIGTIIRAMPVMPAMLLAWALIVIGAIIFALPRCQNDSYRHCFIWGGLYGLILFGTFNLSNYAFLTQWTLTLSLIEIVYGILSMGLLLIVLSWVHKRA